MITKPLIPFPDTASLIAAERPRLVGLCAALARDTAVAEDLAQETLIEALRLRNRVYDPCGLNPWLNAIARNVCARWLRRRGRDLARFHEPIGEDNLGVALPDVWNMDVELERHELADLLDRALALLPAETRTVLIARYVEEMPHGEIAQRLRLSEGAVTMRIQRGRLALQRILGDQLRHEANAYGLVGDSLNQPTGIWCPLCGQQRLACHIDRESGLMRFVCPACAIGEERHIASMVDRALLADVRSPKAILTRLISWLNGFYRSALAHHKATCVVCGQHCVVIEQLPVNVSTSVWGHYGMSIMCSSCRYNEVQSLQYLVMDLPAVQGFWRKHPRMRLAGERPVTLQGRGASLVTFENVAATARIEVVSAIDTFEVLTVEQTP